MGIAKQAVKFMPSTKYSLLIYSGCQKNVAVFKRFFDNHLSRNSVMRNIRMESGENSI
jgi:hypothetical protein